MPANRNALIRYKTIDKCLSNKYRRWTLDDLIEEVSEALYEYEGIRKGVSRRTIQGDIQIMRSDKLGYNAPIVVEEKKYYVYEDPDYSITNIPLSDNDLEQISGTVEFLKQFKDFPHFRELDMMLHKLEDKVHAQQTQQKSVIDFEKNENLKGLEFIDPLYKAITGKKALMLCYQSFKARWPNTFEFFPYLLKEFRNRWFVVGMRYGHKDVINLALDRIIEIDEAKIPFRENPDFDPESYFKHAIGVSVTDRMNVEEVILFFNHKHAPYVLTKPLHHTQELLSRNYFGITVRLRVQHNFELEKDLLGFGEGVKVIQPRKLRENVKRRLMDAADNYHTDYQELGLNKLERNLKYLGHAYVKYVYERYDLRAVFHVLNEHFGNALDDLQSGVNLVQVLPELKTILRNEVMNSILESFEKEVIFAEIRYHATESFSPKTWQQLPEEEETYTLIIPLHTSKNKSLIVDFVAGSNKTVLDQERQDFVIDNLVISSRELRKGDIFIFHPLLLHSWYTRKGKFMLRWFEVKLQFQKP